MKKRGHRHPTETVTVRDATGKILHQIIQPRRIDFHPKDLLQVIVGAAILAIPVGFTEETWNLGSVLPMKNIYLFGLLSILFIGAFVYYSYYKHHYNVQKHMYTYLTRVISTYAFSFITVAVLLSLIQVAPWSTDIVLAFKRTVLVTFPASMSAAVADTIK